MLKVFVPTQNVKIEGELKFILLSGIENHPKLTFSDTEEESDIILLDFRHVHAGYKIKYPKKTILLDYDDVKSLYNVDVCLYFKRSVIHNHKFVNYNREFDYNLASNTLRYENSAKYLLRISKKMLFGSQIRTDRKVPIIPISYCVKSEYLEFEDFLKNERKFDVSCFFDPDDNLKYRQIKYRQSVARCIRGHFRDYVTFVGLCGEAKEKGRNELNPDYFNKMLNSKIVVTCNPDRWEGDSRLFEALNSGSLVFVDKMITPVKNPFIDGEHLIYYDRDNLDDLIEKVKYYLNHPKKASVIAKKGYEHTLKYHTAKNRMDEVIAEFHKILKN